MTTYDYLSNNYTKLLAAISDELTDVTQKYKGDVLEMVVDHDDECPFLVADGRCRCNPVIRIKHLGYTVKRWEYRKVFGEESDGKD